MHSSLSTDFILLKIFYKLTLQEKFAVQAVCRQWKNIAIECLRRHEHLAMIIQYMDLPEWVVLCDDFANVDKDENEIWGKATDLKFWQRILSLLQGVKYVWISYFDKSNKPMFPFYKPLLQLVIDSYRQSLECLVIPGHGHDQDETFPLTDSLPRLKHLLIGHTTSQVTKNILSACPNLEYLDSSTPFTEWQMLPKGFKTLCNYDQSGINNVLCSPAVESLEIVRRFVMTSEICYQSYHLSCLKNFEVIIDFDVANCLRNLARILSFAPVLRRLEINITVFEEIEPEIWIKVLSECQNLIHLEVNQHKIIRTTLINMSSWEDHFVKTIVSKMKKLEYLYTSFHLSSNGFRLLSQLENLKSFSHGIRDDLPDDNVFDTDALIHFLSLSLGKKLKYYRFYIGPTECLILKESFYDFIYKMERKHFIRFRIPQADSHRYPGIEVYDPEESSGMIYLAKLEVNEWDLIPPYL